VNHDVVATRSDTATSVTQPDDSVDSVPTTDGAEQTSPTDTASVPPPVSLPTTTEAPADPDDPGDPDGLIPTADGAGDLLYPALGNPGIDVVSYAVDLAYDHDARALTGSVTLVVMPTEDRTSFTLDSSGPVVGRVVVDGVDAAFQADDPELRITPTVPLRRGQQVQVRVEYTATPDALSSGALLPAGWFNTLDGSYVLNEPDGARTWLPSNDHPSDKATWTFQVTVASGVTAVANGALVSSTDGPQGTTWVWREDDPMPTYLVMLATGQYELVEGAGPAGLPLLSAVLTTDRQKVQPYLDSIDDQIDYFDDFFGPYPLDRYGIAVTDSLGGLAMETLGRSLFSRTDLNGDVGYIQELLLSHELAHQWFGDAVSPLRWQDIWLNESFATYGEWMWLEHAGLTTLDEEASQTLNERQQSTGNPTGSPTAAGLFDYNSYQGGAVVLHALRRTIGDDKFFTVLQRWVAENNGTSRSTDDFILLATEVAGIDLTQLFDDWLYADTLPAAFP
jgi:aminopeptidase N